MAGTGLRASESHRCRRAERTPPRSRFGALGTLSRHSAPRSSPAFLAAGCRCALVGTLLFWDTASGEEVEEQNQQVSGRPGPHVAGVSDPRSARRRLRGVCDRCASAWGPGRVGVYARSCAGEALSPLKRRHGFLSGAEERPTLMGAPGRAWGSPGKREQSVGH